MQSVERHKRRLWALAAAADTERLTTAEDAAYFVSNAACMCDNASYLTGPRLAAPLRAISRRLKRSDRRLSDLIALRTTLANTRDNELAAELTKALRGASTPAVV